jgi:flagellar hook assembly protein FlgD
LPRGSRTLGRGPSSPSARRQPSPIFDAAGRVVRRIEVTGRTGTNSIAWDGKNEAGRHVPSGIYFAVLKNGPVTLRRTFVVEH